jgi:hypothetical protein
VIRLAAGLSSLLALSACAEHTERAEPSAGPGSPPGPPASCAPEAASGLVVKGEDLDGYPPYAVEGCALVYLREDGVLVHRDLTDGTETTMAGADEQPRRPAISAGLVAWEATAGGRSVVRVRRGLEVRTVSGDFEAAAEPRLRESSLVFTGFRAGGDADVWLYDWDEDLATMVIGGPGEQRFADVSAAFVAATDFAEDPDGRYDGDGTDLADVVIYDRRTGALVTRRAPGKQAFPMLGSDGVLAYLEWVLVHPEPKLVAYDLKAGAPLERVSSDRTIAHVVNVTGTYARPALSGGVLEWVQASDGRTALHRAPASGAAPAQVALELPDAVLHAPALTTQAGGGLTIVAATKAIASSRVPRLEVVRR